MGAVLLVSLIWIEEMKLKRWPSGECLHSGWMSCVGGGDLMKNLWLILFHAAARTKPARKRTKVCDSAESHRHDEMFPHRVCLVIHKDAVYSLKSQEGMWWMNQAGSSDMLPYMSFKRSLPLVACSMPIEKRGWTVSLSRLIKSSTTFIFPMSHLCVPNRFDRFSSVDRL